VLDGLLALTLTVLSISTVVTRADYDGGWLGLGLVTLAVAPLAARQIAPVLTLLVVCSALGAYALAGFGEPPSAAIGMLIAMFTVATLRSRRIAAATFPATICVTLTFLTMEGVPWPAAAQATVVCLGAWALGETTRRWAQEAEASAAAAERAVASERARIARELHDVVAHHMSVVALQTGVAGYVLATDGAAARKAITSAASAAREALADMGRMLGALRADDGLDSADLTPQPGLADLAQLVDNMRSAGLEIRKTVSADIGDLSPGVDLCAFRIVQESLTNVLRHAGVGASAHVSVWRDARTLHIAVTDDGPPQVVPRVRGGASKHLGGLGCLPMSTELLTTVSHASWVEPTCSSARQAVARPVPQADERLAGNHAHAPSIHA
jgi:signal transduction histidine kinase